MLNRGRDVETFCSEQLCLCCAAVPCWCNFVAFICAFCVSNHSFHCTSQTKSSLKSEILIRGFLSLFAHLHFAHPPTNVLFHSALLRCFTTYLSKQLNLLAERSGVVLRTEAGVPVGPVQTGAAVGAQVVFAHVSLFLAVRARVAELTGALVAPPGDAAVAVNAGIRSAGVQEEVAVSPGPALGAAAVVRVEEVLALPAIQTRVWITHRGPAAADERRLRRRLDELLLLHAGEVHARRAKVRKGDPTQLHGAQTTGEGPAGVGGQSPQEDVHPLSEEVQVASSAGGSAGFFDVFIEHQSPPRGLLPRCCHEKVDTVPFAVADTAPAAQADRRYALLFVGALKLHEEETILDGDRDESGALLGM